MGSDLVVTFSLSKDTILTMIPPTLISTIKLFLDTELRERVKVLPRSNIKAVLLHKVLTELITAFSISNIVKALAKHFEGKNIGLGLETRNILHTMKFLEENNLKVDYIMMSINPLGYRMTLLKESGERAIVEPSA
ncbi:MAG: hypothetical protein QXN03_01160 [Desulfurococcaceae archaeon]